jgi:hypothetical protein
MPPPELLRTADMDGDGSGLTQGWPVEQHRQALSMKDTTWAAEFGQASKLSPVSASVQPNMMNSSERTYVSLVASHFWLMSLQFNEDISTSPLRVCGGFLCLWACMAWVSELVRIRVSVDH